MGLMELTNWEGLGFQEDQRDWLRPGCVLEDDLVVGGRGRIKADGPS